MNSYDFVDESYYVLLGNDGQLPDNLDLVFQNEIEMEYFLDDNPDIVPARFLEIKIKTATMDD